MAGGVCAVNQPPPAPRAPVVPAFTENALEHPPEHRLCPQSSYFLETRPWRWNRWIRGDDGFPASVPGLPQPGTRPPSGGCRAVTLRAGDADALERNMFTLHFKDPL